MPSDTATTPDRAGCVCDCCDNGGCGGDDGWLEELRRAVAGLGRPARQDHPEVLDEGRRWSEVDVREGKEDGGEREEKLSGGSAKKMLGACA